MAELITYRDAVAEGIAREMRRDPSVVCIGEDIGAAGGVFKTAAGLYDEFGGFTLGIVFAHEFGHVLGLSHPDQCNADFNVLMRSSSKFFSQDPCFVRECVRTDDRLVGLDCEAREVAHEPRGRGDLVGGDRGGEVRELRRAGPKGHHDLFETRIARALAQTVDGHLDLARARLHRGQGVRRGEPQVVVAVDGDDGAVADALLHAPDERAELGRRDAARRRRHHCRSSADRAGPIRHRAGLPRCRGGVRQRRWGGGPDLPDFRVAAGGVSNLTVIHGLVPWIHSYAARTDE